MGLQYWEQLALEHGISPDGAPSPYPNTDFQFQLEDSIPSDTKNRDDRAELFFSQLDDNKYTPRLVLYDLEPSVIAKATSTMPMFNPRNVHLSETGSGAANNWLKGYKYGVEHQEELMDLVDREVDKCNNVSSFQLIHSVAGGTGSGVGSLLLELLNDRYGLKKIVNTFSVFPSNEMTSDIVVQPYNTLLTLKRMIEFGDGSFVFENDALYALENTLHGSRLDSAAFDGTNKLIARACASISNPIRFPGYMYTSQELIFLLLIPTPDLKFLTTSIAPFGRKTSLNEYDITLELLSDRYKMNRVSGLVKYISMLNYFIGDKLNQHEIRKGTIRAALRVEFVPWTLASIHVVNSRRSPYVSSPVNGIQVSNNTSIIHVLSKVLKQYDLLAKRKAYINYYTDDQNDPQLAAQMSDVFAECKEAVVSVIDEYRACQTLEYLE